MTVKANSSSQQVHWSFWLGVGFFVLVIIGLISFCWFVNARLNAEENSPVTQLVVMGDMPYTQVADIEDVIDAASLNNFFTLDVNQIHQQVSQLPWVYSVAVRKKWPNELKIYVIDQKPVALWNGDFLLNAEGHAFQADQSRLTINLPSFYGPEGSEKTALENYHNLNRLLQFSKLAIDELMLSERFSWQLTLTDGVQLNLGRENRVERVQRFMDVYPEIVKHKQTQQQVEYVDLRYDTGLAVGWKTIEDRPNSTNNKRA